MNSSDIHVLAEASVTSLRVKPAPQASAIPTQFSYSPSDDGTDENLLILLHGLGERGVGPLS